MDSNLTYALLMIPLLLLISLTVLQSFYAGTQATFEGTMINESLGTAAEVDVTYTAAFYGTDVNAVLYNASGLCAAPTKCIINDNNGATRMQVTTNATGVMTLRYTPYNKGGNGTGYASYLSTYRGTMNGYNLGALLPYILIAFVVIGIIVGGLMIGG